MAAVCLRGVFSASGALSKVPSSLWGLRLQRDRPLQEGARPLPNQAEQERERGSKSQQEGGVCRAWNTVGGRPRRSQELTWIRRFGRARERQRLRQSELRSAWRCTAGSDRQQSGRNGGALPGRWPEALTEQDTRPQRPAKWMTLHGNSGEIGSGILSKTHSPYSRVQELGRLRRRVGCAFPLDFDPSGPPTPARLFRLNCGR